VPREKLAHVIGQRFFTGARLSAPLLCDPFRVGKLLDRLLPPGAKPQAITCIPFRDTQVAARFSKHGSTKLPPPRYHPRLVNVNRAYRAVFNITDEGAVTPFKM
jgi:hypothetical protein